jgi:hypothetical protein
LGHNQYQLIGLPSGCAEKNLFSRHFARDVKLISIILYENEAFCGLLWQTLKITFSSVPKAIIVYLLAIGILLDHINTANWHVASSLMLLLPISGGQLNNWSVVK